MSETADLYRAGLTLKEIGQRHGISHVAVWKRLRKEGVELRRTGAKPLPIADHAFRIGDGLPIKRDDKVGARCRRSRELEIVAWRALFPLTDDERQIVRDCLDVDNLTFPDTIEVIEDHRNA